jgi:hypothetical protein
MYSSPNKIEPNIRGSIMSVDNGGNGAMLKSPILENPNLFKILPTVNELDKDNSFLDNSLLFENKARSSNMNRSCIDFEKDKFIDKNASFVKINKTKFSSNISYDGLQDQSDLDRSTSSMYKPRPEEVVSKEEMKNLINIFDRKPISKAKSIRKKNNAWKKKQTLRKEKTLKNEKIEKIEKKEQIEEESSSLSMLSHIDNLNLPLQIKKTQNLTKNKNSLLCSSEVKLEINQHIKNPFISKESEANINVNATNNNNKFWNAIDAVFDSAKEKENLFDEFDESEMTGFNFNISALKGRDKENVQKNEQKNILKSNNIENSRNTKISKIDSMKSENDNPFDEEDLVYFDGRNRQVFSFYNKNGNPRNNKNINNDVPSNIKKPEDNNKNEKLIISKELKKKNDIWEIDSIPENLNENWNDISNIKENKDYDQITKAKNKNDSMIERLGSNGIKNNNKQELKLSLVSEFQVSNIHNKNIDGNNVKTQDKNLGSDIHNNLVSNILPPKDNLPNFIRESIGRESLKLNLDIFKQNERKKRNKNLEDFLIKDNLTNNTNNTLMNTIDIVNTYPPTPPEMEVQESNINNVSNSHIHNKKTDSYYERYKIIKQDSKDERNLKTISHSFTPVIKSDASHSQDRSKTNKNLLHVQIPEDDSDIDKGIKNKIYQGEIDRTAHQFVALQKHLPYSKFNLDLKRKSRIGQQDKNEVLYNNIADFTTLNQLINSVKKASHNQVESLKNNANKNHQLQISKNLLANTMNVNEVMKLVGNNNQKHMNIKQSHSPVNHNILQNNKNKATLSNLSNNPSKTLVSTPRKNNNNLNKASQSPITNSNNNLANIGSTSPHASQLNNKNNSNSSNSLIKEKDKKSNSNTPITPLTSTSNTTSSNINEKFLMEMLEEIKEKNNHVQKYFLLKETAMKREIEDLKSKLKIQMEKEKNLSEEVEELKLKLAFFADDISNSKKRDKEKDLYGNTNTTNTTKRNYHEDYLQEKESPPILNVLPSPEKKSGRPPRISLSAIPDLGDFNSEEKFVQKYHVSRLKSYALLLKDIGLDPSTFYDDLIFSNKDLEDDICYDCTSAPLDHKCLEGKWNYALILRKHPKLKNFILLMAKKLLYDNRARLKLEEKTLKIFSNDLKAIDQLVRKL